MYLTQNDIINLKMGEFASLTATETIKNLVKEVRESEQFEAMLDGTKYYKVKNEILKHDFREYFVNLEVMKDLNKSNKRIVHAYHKLLVDQKASYIASRPATFQVKNTQPFLNDILSKSSFHKTTFEIIKAASNNGASYLHIYINEKGEFAYTIIPATEIIPIYENSYSKKLKSVIRHYYQETYYKEYGATKKKDLLQVEIWTDKDVFFLSEDFKGELIKSPIDPNPRGHWYRTNTFSSSTKAESWGLVPFIELENNAERMTDLQTIKSLVDDYDFNLSDLSNKIVDIARAIWILKGYEGSSLSEFMYNLHTFNAMKVKADGDAVSKTLEIPTTAYDSHMNRIEDNIFVFGMGVNPKIDKFGNSPSGISLKFMYGGLDLKSNLVISSAKDVFSQFSEFVKIYSEKILKKNLDLTGFDVIFNKSLIVNDKEVVEIAQMSKGIISDETIIANHPWINNVTEEMERLKKQKEDETDPYRDIVDE